MESPIPRIELTPGYSVCRVIIGLWQLAGGHGTVDPQAAMDDLRRFAEAGFNTFDCADIYTGVEELLGRFLEENRSRFASGELPSLQIHTKYVPDLESLPALSKKYTQAVIDRSLARLGVERLDLVQFHWWDFQIPGYAEAASHLAELQRQGKILHLGVTNFDAVRLRELLDAGVPIITNQVQYSLLDARPEQDLSHIAGAYGFKLLCYGTLAGGFLSERFYGKALTAADLTNRSLIKYRLIIEEFGGVALFQDLLEALKTAADRHGVGIADIAARYILQRPHVAGIIIGARNSSHREKLACLHGFQLDRSDLEPLADIISRAKGPLGPVFGLERDREGPHGRIMKYDLNRVKTG